MLVIPSIPAAELFFSLQMNERKSSIEHQQWDMLKEISFLGIGESEMSAELKHWSMQKMSGILAEVEPDILLLLMVSGMGDFITRARFAVAPKTFARGNIIKEITEKNNNNNNNLFGMFDFVT